MAASEAETPVYGFNGTRPEFRLSLPSLGIDASTQGAAILPTPVLDEFAVISPSGHVQMITAS